MQALVPIGLWYAQPVSHAFRIRLVHVCYYCKHLPALHLLQLNRRIKDYTYCKKVVNALETTLLFLHLLPDAVYTLGTSFHVEFELCILQLFIYRCYEAFNISITTLFGGIELVLYHVVSIVLKILQAEVFQLALQFVQTQLVSQRCIQVTRLLAYFRLCLKVLCIPYLSHKVYAIGNHY